MAETGMVERCAAAIYLARNGRGAVPWSRRDASHKAPYLIDARAAIEAMPLAGLVALLERASEALRAVNHDSLADDIDAALKEGD